MSLTRIGSIGINTGIAFAGVTTIVTLNTANDALSIGATVNVGSGITLGASGDIFATGVTTTGSLVSSGAISGTTGTFSGDVTTSGGDLTVTGTNPIIHLTDTDDNSDYQLNVNGGVFQVYDYTNSAGRLLVASDGTVTVAQDLAIADKIIHTGDTNTAIRFPSADTITAETGGSERTRIDSSGRLLIGLTESATTDSNAHSKLQVVSSAGPNIGLGNNSSDIDDDDRLGVINFSSNHGGSYHEVTTIRSAADADHTSSSKASRLELYTTSSGNTVGTERLRIGSAGQIGIGGANYGSSGQVLTSGGSSSAVTWSTISGTTINNNANNKVITGSDTANTLEGEAYVHASGASLSVGTQSPAYSANIHIRNSYASFRMDSDGSNNHTTFSQITGTGKENRFYFGDAADDDVGQIVYDHNGDQLKFVVGASERMRLDADGLSFNGDTAATNSLDDYEEGTYTPVFNGGTSGISYTVQSGNYVKIGKLVRFDFYILVNGGVSNGSMISFNLPMNSAADTNSHRGSGVITYHNINNGNSGSNDFPALYITSASAQCYMGATQWTASSGSAQSNRYFIGGGTYHAA